MSSLAWTLALLATAPTFAQSPAPRPVEAPPAPATVTFVELSLSDAVSRAEHERRLLLVFWSSENYADAARMRATTFHDAELAAWVAANALAVEVDGPKDTASAIAYKVSQYPSVDLYDPLLGIGVERLVGYSTADDLLAAFSGALVGGATAPKPDGEASADPYAWLGYANSTWRSPATAVESARAYGWVLHHADEHRPGFRARYFEFLLRRLAYLKPATVVALEVLDAERIKLEGALFAGRDDARTVYELARIDWWLRRESLTRETYLGLAGRGEAQERARRALLRFVLDDLGRNQHFEALLAGLGEESAPDYLRRRLSTLEVDLKAIAEGAAVGPERLDDRGTIVMAASWLYEALLATGRGADAGALVDLVAERLPTGRAFALLVERALRQEQFELAVRVGTRGLALVGGTPGERQLRRALAKVPGYVPPKESPSPVDGEPGGDGDGGPSSDER